MPASPRRRTTRATTGKSSLNSPQRERLPGSKSGVTIVKKVKLTVVTAASERPSFSESQRMERANVFIEFDLNEHSVLVALLVNAKDSCRDGSHICHFLRQTSPEMEPAPKELQARIGTRGGERTDDIRACLRPSPVLSPGKLAVTGDIEAFLRKIESRFRVTGNLSKLIYSEVTVSFLGLRDHKGSYSELVWAELKPLSNIVFL
jgi:hypothetical protein